MNRLINITEIIIRLINSHYYDLQMFANYVIGIDNDTKKLLKNNNISTRIILISKLYSTEKILFDVYNMESIMNYVLDMDNATEQMKIVPTYLGFDFFNCGSVSTSVIFRKDNIILKIFPCQLLHHYSFLPDKISKQIISRDFESPNFAIFYKEAWMYFFCRNVMSPYTSAFECIVNCGTTRGFPINITSAIKNDYQTTQDSKKITKKWFDYLISDIKNPIHNAIFACFEMKKIEGTMTDLIHNITGILTQLKTMDNIPNESTVTSELCEKLRQTRNVLSINGSLVGHRIVNNIITKHELVNQKQILLRNLSSHQINLSYFFEYMYAKMITAFIGKVIFTDDHFDNIAYITVNYWRSYKIKCNGCDYNFYMPPGKMVQFIDYERYIFNYSQYDIYTNAALKQIPIEEFRYASAHLKEIKDNYVTNEYIYDKGIYAFIDPRELDPRVFISMEEYDIMVNILMDNFIYDIKTFCQVMSAHLPKKYQTKPSYQTKSFDQKIKSFYIDLDDNNIRAIDNKIMKKITL